jgi:DinB superfamily
MVVSMDAATRRDLIDRYRDGHAAVAAALDGATPAELDHRPAAGEWTAREVVHHLADAEARSATRVRQLLAEDDAQIQGYDQNTYARRLHYDRPIDASLDLLRAVRAATAELLETLDPQEWARTGTHSEDGAYSVEGWLEIYATHAHDHAEQIRAARSSAAGGSAAS